MPGAGKLTGMVTFIIGSIIGALVLLILLRLFHAEPGRRR